MTTPLPLTEISGFPGLFALTLEPNHGPMVVLDHEYMQRLEAALTAAPESARGLVVHSGSDRVFVAGADLKTIQAWDDAQLLAYLKQGSRTFARLCRLPYPTAAAIAGAALGGGLELAMHCDGLIASPAASGRPYPIGLPEASLGICPGWGGTNLLPARIEPSTAIAQTAEGKPLIFDAAAEAGLFDAIADSAPALLDTAADWLHNNPGGPGIRRDGEPLWWIGRPEFADTVRSGLQHARPRLPQTDAAAAVVRAVEAGLAEGWSAALETEQRELVRLRSTPVARAAISAFLDKGAKR